MALNFFSLLALTAGLVMATPGIQGSVSSGVLNDVIKHKLPKILSNITNYDLGDYSDDFEFALIKGSFKASDMTLKKVSFDPSSTSVSYEAPNWISAVISDVSLDLRMKLKVKYGLISDTYDKFEVSTTKAKASATFALVASSAGTLEIDLKSFDLKLGDLDVQTHTVGGLPIKIIVKMFKPFISDAIEKGVKDEVPDINKKLSGLSYQFQLPKTTIDLHFAAQPQVVDGNYYLVQLTGTTTSPSSMQDLTPTDPQYDIQLQLSDSVLSAVLEMVWPFVDVTISEFDGIKLTTDTVGLFIPGLAKTFGHGQPLGLHVRIDYAYTPQLTFNPTVQLLIQPDIEFLVYVNSTWEHAFTLNLQTNVQASFEVTDADLSAKVSSVKFTSVTYSDSVIGTINIVELKLLLSEAVGIVVPLVNSKLANVTLPLSEVPYFDVTTDQVLSITGALDLGLDLAVKA